MLHEKELGLHLMIDTNIAKDLIEELRGSNNLEQYRTMLKR